MRLKRMKTKKAELKSVLGFITLDLKGIENYDAAAMDFNSTYS